MMSMANREISVNIPGDLDVKTADLLTAQGIWLVSSITLAARVHTLDGRALAPSPLAGEFAELVDAAIVSDR